MHASLTHIFTLATEAPPPGVFAPDNGAGVMPMVINYLYLLAAVLFILGLKMLSNVKTAARGNRVSSAGMLLACVVTLFYVTGGTAISLLWIGIAMLVGAVIGLTLALKVPMTGMPQMVALLNGFGGIASLLVAYADYHAKLGLMKRLYTIEAGQQEGVAAAVQQLAKQVPQVLPATGTPVLPQTATDPSVIGRIFEYGFTGYGLVTTGLAMLIGGVTFTGSLIAFGKLQGLKITPSKPIQFPGQKAVIGLLLVGCIALSFVPLFLGAGDGGDAMQLIDVTRSWGWCFLVVALVALLLGILLVIGIGGADMPVVVSLLNSYSGIAASMAGFVLNNQALIITGSLVGASGIILTTIMCKAMNRSLMNVLFGGVGGTPAKSKASGAEADQGTAKEFSVEDAALILDAARQVVIVPGYGMAVAQAQHVVAELASVLEDRGITVKYAIHPVAGRMPGHMNVLLAEANVPYDQLCDLEQINPEFEQTDVSLVIGANDVTNPAARHATDSPIYGMPILDVDKSRTVMVIKRSMSPGYAGIQNELYFADNCGMIFGDGKKIVTALVQELKAE